MNFSKHSIAFTFAGTGGHVYPCIALAQEMPANSFYFIGSNHRKDAEIIQSYQYPFLAITSSRTNIFKILKSFWQARKILKNKKTKLLISAGGYLTFPVALAAKTLGIPLFLLEQNTLPGRVNRYLAFLATKIFISFEESAKYFPKDKTILSGNPVRKFFLEDNCYLKIKELEINIPSEYPQILIFGGSQGAQTINNIFYHNYEYFMDKPYIIWHVTGNKFYQQNFPNNPTFTTLKNQLNQIKIITLPYFEKMDYLYQKCSIVICRSGATTLAELIEFEKPSILIPYPYAKDNHQYYNALHMVNQELATLIPETGLTFPLLWQTIEKQLQQPIGYNAKDKKPQARKYILQEISAYL